jgi:hypothetical protein
MVLSFVLCLRLFSFLLSAYKLLNNMLVLIHFISIPSLPKLDEKILFKWDIFMSLFSNTYRFILVHIVVGIYLLQLCNPSSRDLLRFKCVSKMSTDSNFSMTFYASTRGKEASQPSLFNSVSSTSVMIVGI